MNVPTTATEAAPAKVNLALAVIGRAPNGYHLIDTLAVFSGAGDRIEVAPAEALSLEVTGPFAGSLIDPNSNLVIRAAEALRREAFGDDSSPGASIRLDKALPVASGLGGGSADAAATLRALNRHWELDWSLARLAELGVELGADVPMCLLSRPLRARGIGEDIAPLTAFPALNLVLINPGVAVSTAEVFSELGGHFSKALPNPAGVATLDAALDCMALTVNDLEAPAVRVAPVVSEVLNALRASRQCLFARMSGSGATCFGIYREAANAQAAADVIAAARPDWWVRATRTGAA